MKQYKKKRLKTSHKAEAAALEQEHNEHVDRHKQVIERQTCGLQLMGEDTKNIGQSKVQTYINEGRTW